MNGIHANSNNQSNVSPKRKADEVDVIEITDSSDDETRHKLSKPTKGSRASSKLKSGKTRAKSRPLAESSASIILLDGPQKKKKESTSSTAVRDLEKLLEKANKRIKEKEKENENLRKANEGLQKEREALLQQAIAVKGNKGPDANIEELDEITTCEICSERMWQPALLPDCGHVFCERCLQDWFSQILERHVQDNPHYYDREPLHPTILHFLMMPHFWHHPQARLLVQQAAAALPKSPVYTCPSCREICTTAPSEVYPFKKCVSIAAKALGEGDSPLITGQRRPKGDSFSGFFPRRPQL